MIFITYMRYRVLGRILGGDCFSAILHENEKTFKIEMPNELFFIFLPNDYSFL
jgi:hypothetical protein